MCVFKKKNSNSVWSQTGNFPSAFFQSAKTGWAGRAVSLSADQLACLAYQADRQRDDLIGWHPEHAHKGLFDERVLG